MVIEHARQAGRKILMSGGGRCNFTNMYAEPENYLSANPHFCKSALSRYTPWDFIALVEKHAIAYHEKELGQLFCDESSKDIVKMLLDECTAYGVTVLLACSVTKTTARNGGFSVQTSHGDLSCESLVVASGGLSIPKMGATGFGYEIAEQFGHTITSRRAGLAPLTLSGVTQEQFEGLSGLSTPVEVSAGGAQFRGALLLTHRGLSGPAILQISSYWQLGEELIINWLPDVPDDEALIEHKRSQPRSDILSWLIQALPRRLAERLLALAQTNTGLAKPHQRLADHSDEALRGLLQWLQHWPIKPSGTEGYRTAEVTLGGVNTDELSSRSMASNLQPGLFFIGEVIDVSGHLGGYNFQWAWASAHAAGECV